LTSEELVNRFLESLQELKCNINKTDVFNALAYALAVYPEAKEIVVISDMEQNLKRIWMLEGKGKKLKVYLLNPIKVRNIQKGYDKGVRIKRRIERTFRRSGFNPVEVRLINVIVR
jgi:hypothetical protein